METENDGIVVLDEGIVESAEYLVTCCAGTQTVLKH
jgi:hypothetical protein